MKKIFLFPLLAAIIFSSCNIVGGKRIRGNGDIKTEIREERGFQSLEIGGAIKVFIKQDSAYSVKVEADANLLQYIETYIQKNTLVIRPENGHNLRPTNSIKVYVNGPSFRHFQVSGASSIRSESRIISADELYINLSGASTANMDIKSPRVGLEVTGASTATVTGETKDLQVEGTGASHANCFGLLSENVKVDISGASGAEVFASVKLDLSASGASHVRYRGSASIVGQNVSEAASVKKAE